VHLRIILVGNQLDAQSLLWYVYLNPLQVLSNPVLWRTISSMICLFESSTSFEQPCALTHNLFYDMFIWIFYKFRATLCLDAQSLLWFVYLNPLQVLSNPVPWHTISSMICLFESSTSFEQPYAHPQEGSCINTSGIITPCSWPSGMRVISSILTCIRTATNTEVLYKMLY
jgi:hypothetical protein